MMTWFTRMSMFDSLEDLAIPQLALAHRESESLFNELVFGEPTEGNSPAPLPLTRMWIGYEAALAAYSVSCSIILVSHGISNGYPASFRMSSAVQRLRRDGDPTPFIMPPWIQDIDFLMSQRSNLMRRWPEAYDFPRNPRDMPYLWPIVDDYGGYVLKLSKYDRGLLETGERSLSDEVLERIKP